MKTKKILLISKLFAICACITLSFILLLALGIFNAGSADVPHTHRACGEAECNHEGERHSPIVWTSLDQTVFDGFYNAEQDAYLIPAGNYYLSGNITTQYTTRIEGKTNLCLNGFTMNCNKSRYIVIADDLSICDCSLAQSGIIDGSSISTVEDSGAVFNLYSGTIGGRYARLNLYGGTTFNMYGGLIENIDGDSITVFQNATMNQYGGIVKGLRFSIYLQGTYNMYGGYLSQYNSDADASSAAALYTLSDSCANIFKGSMTSSGYGINYGGCNMTISPKENSDVVIHGSDGAMYGNAGVNTFVLTVNGGTFTSDSDMAIYISAPTVINNAPDIQGNLQLAIRSVADRENEYLLDVSGYTGEEKLQIYYARTPSEDFAIVKGNTSQAALVNEGWTFADGTDTAETPNAVLILKEIVHSHKACGELTCSHAGDTHSDDVEYTALDQALFDSWYDDSIKQYVIPDGNWYLTEDIVLTTCYDDTITDSGRVMITAEKITNLCLNGKSLNLGGNALYAFGGAEGGLNLCDCSEYQSGIISSDTRDYFSAVIFVQNMNLYSGNIQSAPGGVALQLHSDTLNMYGGYISGENYGIKQIGLCTFNMYGGTVNGGYTAYNAYNGVANISGGILLGATYAIDAEIMELNILEDTIIYSDGIGIYVRSSEYTYNENKITLNNAEIYAATGQPAIYVASDETCKITASGNTVLSGAVMTTVGTDADGAYYLDALGYTGKNSITLILDSAALVEDTVIAKGTAKGLAIASADFALVSDKDANGNDVVKVISHTSHTAGDITCIGTFCTVCEQYYGAPDTDAHLFGELVAEIPATCIETGTKEYKECTLCGNYFDRDGVEIFDLVIEIDTDAHAWDQGTVVTAATCTTPGETLYVCSHNAEHTKTETTFDPDAHAWDDGTVSVAATCISKGTMIFTCENNEQHLRIEDIAIDETAHAWGEWTRTADPTCSAVGTDARVCTLNSAHTETRDVAIDETAHAWGEWARTTDPSCSAVGTDTRVCSHNTEHIETRDVAIDETAHAWGDWVRTTEPTCSAPGQDTKTCAHNTEHTQTRNVEALGHEFSVEQENEKEYWNKCVRCDETDTPVEIETQEQGFFAKLFSGKLFDGKIGCGSSVGGGIAIIISIFAAGAYMLKKKED